MFRQDREAVEKIKIKKRPATASRNLTLRGLGLTLLLAGKLPHCSFLEVVGPQQPNCADHKLHMHMYFAADLGVSNSILHAAEYTQQRNYTQQSRSRLSELNRNRIAS